MDDISIYWLILWLDGKIMADIKTSSMDGILRGNTSNKPISSNVGDLYINTETGIIEIYLSTGWSKVAPTPNPPTAVSATQLTATTASITFTAPTSGPTVNSYIVTSSGGQTATGSSSPITISGLVLGSSYTFTIQSVNDNGMGNASAESSSITIGLPEVTGGTLASDSTYYYRTFTSSGNLVVSKGSVSMDVLSIAGGGAGGGPATGVYYVHGGGGAGGARYDASYSASPGTYSLTVGAGGSGRIAGDSGNNGSNSQFGSLTAAVGGGGGAATGNYGRSGGSGGGATQSLLPSSPSQGTAVAGQGYIGGTAGYSGGGGGGAGGVGQYTTTSYSNNYQGGAGGPGTDSYSSWLSAITSSMSGVSGWSTATSGGRIAGGGGGGHSTYYGTPSPYLNGGAGGGGNGGAAASGAKAYATGAGVTNTGGGGGGGGADGTTSTAGASGGSGLIIVRYLKTAVA